MNDSKAMPMATRRLFLQQSVLALAATIMPPTLLAAVDLPASPESSEHKALQSLNADDYRVLAAVADTIIPSGGAFPTGARDINLVSRIDSYIHPSDEELITGIRGALMFTEHKAPELIGAKAPFTQLDDEQKEQVLHAMNQGSPLTNTIFTALRGLCLFYFYTDEQVWPHFGYDGPLILQAQKAQQAQKTEG